MNAPKASKYTLIAALALAGCQPGQIVLSGGDTAPAAIDTATPDTAAPSAAEPWLRDEVEAPGPIAFNELHYHPAGDGSLEWLELYNPMAFDMDLSGWSLGDGIDFVFEEGTVLPAGGYLVVAADPAQLAAETGFAGALGPYEGRLSNGGERLSLRSLSGRLIDSVGYGDGGDGLWPVAPDGSGVTLAKLSPNAASDRAEHWTPSATLGGTPGADNGLDPAALPTEWTLIDQDAEWRYDAAGGYPAAGWAEPDYDDSGWQIGQATFYAGGAEGPSAGTAWATADNYFALYLGESDGAALRWIGEDIDGSWTTVETIELEATPRDHLYLAAWELTGDSTTPQMTIAEVEFFESGDAVGTDADSWEWVLGPSDSNPGALPGDAAPGEAELLALVEAAEAGGSWAPPAVDASRGADPWGGSVGGDFSDAARFIWADTFDNDSITNAEDTWALFRTRDPLIAPPGNLELDAVHTTLVFRAGFDFDGDPSAAALYLDCVLDDGAVFYLNGAEVLRENMPGGDVDEETLAISEVDEAELYAEISADALVAGENVLAVEVHQAAREDLDLVFGCALTAEIGASVATPTILLNEIAPAGESPFWVELINASEVERDPGDLLLAASGGGEVAIEGGAMKPGELRLLDAPGLSIAAGDALFLYADGGASLLDAARAGEGLRGRAEGGGSWRSPTAATPGEPNIVALTEDVVINEILYHRAPLSDEGEPFAERDEEWIELYNRGDDPVDLSGWRLADAVSFVFPEGAEIAPGAWLVVAADAAALSADWPDIDVVGDYAGRLGNGGDRILLLDAAGDPADEVRYYDGGRWPKAADGGGSSLELRDPWADNSAAEAWAASDEGDRAEWVAVRSRGEAEDSAVGPDGVWEELVLGLLDAGEVLIDDLSVVQDPDGRHLELLQEGAGTFDDPSLWRLLGNHRHSEIAPDPDDPNNPVLRLVATGSTGHMHNHAETTLALPVESTEHEISFRARWVSGSNQLHSRLYFNRLPRTTLVAQPDRAGTPGAENSALTDELGPTFAELAQDVVVPAPGQPVQISVSVDDPDGVASVALWSAVDGDDFEGQPMSEVEPGRWAAEIDGQSAGSVVQLYVEAEDERGAAATWPAAGPDSRALFVVDDGQAADGGLHTLRILMTEDDADWLHEDVNLMSNDLVGATVVYDEAEIFYDVGVRLKGSQRGRPTSVRLGYGVRFNDDQPFRGSHTSVMIDRSEGVDFGQREVLLNLMMTRAGSPSGEHNDLIRLVAPRSEYTSAAELQLDRFSDLVLASQFEDGDSGIRFEYELVYYPTTTDDGTPEGYKLPQPDTVVGTYITDLGDDPEAYRWLFLIKNNQRRDDYSDLVALCQTFSLSDAAFLQAAPEVIDVDQWLRAFALSTMSGATDQYGGAGSQHNAQIYFRPDDGRALFFPHDLDYFSSSTMAVVGNNDLARLLEDPGYARSYYGHLNDIIETAYTTDYLAPWCDQLGALLPDQDFDSHCAFIDDRADWVLSGSSDSVLSRYPPVDFRITTALSVGGLEVELEGEAWIDVREIALDNAEAGADEPLAITWIDGRTWRVTAPLEAGENTLELIATDLRGAIVGEDTIVVTAE